MTDELEPVAPEFFVPDVGAAARFYCEKLGFTLVRQEPEESPMFAIVVLGHAMFMFAHESLYAGDRAEGRRGVALDVRVVVPDVDAVYERCQKQGVRVVHDIADRYYGLRDFIVEDQDGFRLRFASPLR